MKPLDSGAEITTVPLHTVPVPAPALAIGSVISQQFRIEEKLGDGGMGAVYRCTDLLLRRSIALKVLHPHLATASSSVLRFQQEAKAASLLDHPGIVRVHQLAFDADMPFIVMDYVKGTSLTQVIRKEGALSIGRTVSIMIKVADALEHAHAHGVVHRDLKPSNILICDDGIDDIKVVDFGIAKIIPSDATGHNPPTLTNTGELFGTPAYMSPEQLHGRKVDGRTDQYSFGCVLFECLTAAPPFTGSSMLELVMKQVKEAPISLREASMGTDFPDWIEALVARTLSKRAEDRYQNMTEVKLALLDAGRTAASERAAAEKLRSREAGAKKLKLLTAGAATSLIALAGASGIYFATKYYAANYGRSTIAPNQQHGPTSTSSAITTSAVVPSSTYESKESQLEKAVADRQLAMNVQELQSKALTEIDSAPSVISDDGLACLQTMQNLTSLHLNRCVNITDKGMHLLLYIQRQKNFDLQEISLAETFVTDDGLRSIAQIDSLEHVMLSHMTDITDSGIEAVARLPKLTKVSVEGDDQLTVRSLRAIGAASHIDWLNLSSCHWKRGLGSLTGLKLKYLDVRNCDLYDEDIEEIAKIGTLEELDVRDNKKLSARSLQELMKLKNIERLRLSANAIDSDQILAFLKHMKKKKVSFTN